MALQPLPPVPNTPISDDPTRDSIWKRYLEQLFNRVIPLGPGTVTSVNVSGGTTGLTTSGGPITTSGTITLTGTLIAANGGTGIASYAVGDLLYAATTTTLAKLADVAVGSVLVSGGVGVAPAWGAVPFSGLNPDVLAFAAAN